MKKNYIQIASTGAALLLLAIVSGCDSRTEKSASVATPAPTVPARNNPPAETKSDVPSVEKPASDDVVEEFHAAMKRVEEAKKVMSLVEAMKIKLRKVLEEEELEYTRTLEILKKCEAEVKIAKEAAEKTSIDAMKAEEELRKAGRWPSEEVREAKKKLPALEKERAYILEELAYLSDRAQKKTDDNPSANANEIRTLEEEIGHKRLARKKVEEKYNTQYAIIQSNEAEWKMAIETAKHLDELHKTTREHLYHVTRILEEVKKKIVEAEHKLQKTKDELVTLTQRADVARKVFVEAVVKAGECWEKLGEKEKQTEKDPRITYSADLK